MPKFREELQFPSITSVVKPKEGVSLYNNNGVLTILHANGTSEIIATGDIGSIDLSSYVKNDEIEAIILNTVGDNFGIKTKMVTELPTTGDTNYIYLISNSSNENNEYTEYMYISDNWEIIGSTGVDLTNYALKTDIPTAISSLTNDSGYITATSVSSLYYPKTETYTKTEVSNLISASSPTNVYTKTEIDAKGYATETYVDDKVSGIDGKMSLRTWY